MSVLINPYALAPVAPAATREYRALKSASNQSGTLTISAVDIGAAAVGRYVFCIVSWITSGNVALSSATIGGVTAKIHVQTANNNRTGGTYGRAAIISAPLDAGTTANVVLTLASGASAGLIRCASYKVIGLQSDTPVDTAAIVTPDGDPASIAVQDGGFVLAGVNAYGSGNYSFSGVTEDYESEVGTNAKVAGGSVAIDETAADYSVGVDLSGGSSTFGPLVVGSFR